MNDKKTTGNKLTVSPDEKLIIIGEDDIDDREILEEIFLSIDEDLQFLFINNGQKMVEFLEDLVEEKIPCLIILDYNMPGLNGSEVLKRLHQIEKIKNVPKIIWSTSNASAYKKICLELGANDYLVKPSNIKELEKMLKHMLSFCQV
jgi:CheY-like chemotaxis protein